MNQQNNNDDLHVKLCAALLDELPDEERRFVEQALAADPGLRAERDRLQATIGAVRSAFPRPAALPDHLRAALSAAAEQRAATRPKLARRRFAVACSALAASVLVASAVYLAYEPAEAPAPRPAPGAQAPASVTWAASSHATFSVANDSPYNLPCGPRDQLAQAAAGAKSSVVLLAADCSLRSDSVEVLPAPAPNPAPAELDSETQRLLQEFGYVGSGCLTVAAQPPDTAASILESCRRLPGETPSMMYFRFWGDNPFELASLDNLSTFGVDVDTASYALARNYLTRGLIPEKAQVRTEEFVNYFRPDVPPPQDGVFALHLEAAPSLFGGENRWLLRVVLRARETPPAERPPQNITFVIDTSGSMAQENRLELVKHALRLLLTELKEHDRVAIVRFSTDASLVLPLTSVRERALIEEKLFGLAPQQSTNAAAGLALGYQQALSGFDPEARNSVLLLSDGVANTGVTDHEQITRDAAEYRAKGIALNTVGVGMGNHNDVLLEQLADRGDGTCCYVDTPQEAKRALVDRFSGAFVPGAREAGTRGRARLARDGARAPPAAARPGGRGRRDRAVPRDRRGPGLLRPGQLGLPALGAGRAVRRVPAPQQPRPGRLPRPPGARGAEARPGAWRPRVQRVRRPGRRLARADPEGPAAGRSPRPGDRRGAQERRAPGRDHRPGARRGSHLARTARGGEPPPREEARGAAGGAAARRQVEVPPPLAATPTRRRACGIPGRDRATPAGCGGPLPGCAPGPRRPARRSAGAAAGGGSPGLPPRGPPGGPQGGPQGGPRLSASPRGS
ncbi:MAG: von Willebrand factor type A domain-containing protein [Planctomycetes bacterium]|nr:von Willebrand factor type A domain-containing protein [Planctomycetota bacterium]